MRFFSLEDCEALNALIGTESAVPIVAHNAPYDRDALRQAFERAGAETPPYLDEGSRGPMGWGRWTCTMRMGASLWNGFWRGLDETCRLLDVRGRSDGGGVHDAVEDAEVVGRIFVPLARMAALARRGRLGFGWDDGEPGAPDEFTAGGDMRNGPRDAGDMCSGPAAAQMASEIAAEDIAGDGDEAEQEQEQAGG